MAGGGLLKGTTYFRLLILGPPFAPPFEHVTTAVPLHCFLAIYYELAAPRLGEPVRAGLGAVEHARQRVLGAGGGRGPEGGLGTGDFKH